MPCCTQDASSIFVYTHYNNETTYNDEHTHKHLFIAAHRCLINFLPLTQELERFAGHAFRGHARAIFAQNSSLLTIARALRSARAVVAAHGGQCYNIIFSRENTTFVEVCVHTMYAYMYVHGNIYM